MAVLPTVQHAVQLVGPNELIFNRAKRLNKPGPHQLLCRVEAVGLCYSDLKLLRQFSKHVRKGPIIAGIDRGILDQIPSYVPGEAPTVPGHETVVRIAAVGKDVEEFTSGQRYLVQTDYRWLPTAGSNAAFGYNFEGALQEYVLVDTRVITSPKGESMLLPLSEKLSASAVAMVEPWACVEHSYVSKEQRSLKRQDRLLIVAEVQLGREPLMRLFGRYGHVAQITWLSELQPPMVGLRIKQAATPASLDEAGYDEVTYFGSDAATVESLFARVAAGGLFNIVLCGGRFDRDVATPVGRVHYEGIRIVGTTGWDPNEALQCIPETGEVRAGDKIHIIGAGGPMGMMHVIRNVCHRTEGISVCAGDPDQSRLDKLSRVAAPLAHKNGVTYIAYNQAEEQMFGPFDYTVIMAPRPELAARSVHSAAKGAVINIFAGIPSAVTAEIDLNSYIEKQLYFVGTSGSVIEDMKNMLLELESGRLDTNLCVGAICGLEAASEGLSAVGNRRIAGKIIVYPDCRGLQLIDIEKLGAKLPHVAKGMVGGFWSKQAEDALLLR